MTIVNGANHVDIGATSVTLSAGSGKSIILDNTGAATFTSGGTSTLITGNVLMTGSVLTVTFQTQTFAYAGTVYTSASSGANALPGNPVGFWLLSYGSTTYKVPYYNV